MTHKNQNNIAVQMAILFIFAIILWNTPKLYVNAANIEETQTEEETISIDTTEETIYNAPTTSDNGVAGFAFYYDAEENGDTVKDTIDGYDNIEIKENIITTYKNLGIVNVNNQLNIRKEPNTSSKVSARVKKDTGVDILDKTDDGWLQIQSGEVKGWASAEYIIVGEEALERSVSVSKPYAVVNTNGARLNVRAKDDKESKVLTQLSNGTKSLLKEVKSNGWIKIEYEKNKVGFVSAEYINIKYLLSEAEFLPEPKPEPKSTQTKKSSTYKKKNNSSSSKDNNDNSSNDTNKKEEPEIEYDYSTAESLVAYAKQFVGNPYVWGGTSLTNGADCSGFVLSVFAKYGYSLPHSSSAQSNYGYSISPNTASLEKGDLVFYGDPVYHVAIYIGDGQIVHAANSRKGIIISNMTYMGSPSKARRILK